MIRRITITACTFAAITTLVFLVAGHWGYRSGRIGFALPGSVALVGCDDGHLAISHYCCPRVPPPGGIRPTRGFKTFLSPHAIVSELETLGPLTFVSPQRRFAGAAMSQMYSPNGATVRIGSLTILGCVSTREVNIPLWMPFIFFATFPLIAALRGPLRRRRRRRRGLCVYCAYDLTGNTTGVCSECGRRVARDR